MSEIQEEVQVTPEEKEAQEASEKRFRSEGVISDADLRIGVARNFSRVVHGDESIELTADKMIRAGSDYSFNRNSRTRHVQGNYEQAAYSNETYNMNYAGLIEEQVEQGVYMIAKADINVIMSGAYINTVAGPYMHIGCWADHLIWGGWMETDLARVEISAAALRVYVGFSHVSHAHISCFGRLMDDYGIRTMTAGFEVSKANMVAGLGFLPGLNIISHN